MKHFPILVVALALAGCAGQQLAPPGMPSIAAIQATQAKLAAVPVADVPDFYRVGLLLTQEQCGSYFDEATMQALQNSRNSGQEQLLTGLLTGLAGLSGAGGPVTAGLGLGASFGQQWLQNQQNNSLAGGDPAAAAVLTAAAQQRLIAAMPDPATAAGAISQIFAAYRVCSPAGIEALEQQAVQAAPAHLAVTGASGTPASPAFMPRAMGPMTPIPSNAIPMVQVN